jgi:hypothetical protein
MPGRRAPAEAGIPCHVRFPTQRVRHCLFRSPRDTKAFGGQRSHKLCDGRSTVLRQVKREHVAKLDSAQGPWVGHLVTFACRYDRIMLSPEAGKTVNALCVLHMWHRPRPGGHGAVVAPPLASGDCRQRVHPTRGPRHRSTAAYNERLVEANVCARSQSAHHNRSRGH